MQMDEGIWYPMGGTRAVPEGLAKLAAELGVTFHTSTDVARILTDAPMNGLGKGKVTGLETTDGTRYKFDKVVSNSDAVRTHRELVGGTHAKHFDGDRESMKRPAQASCSILA